MNEPKATRVRSAAVLVAVSGLLLALFHAVGGGLSGGAWVGVAIALAAGVVEALWPRCTRRPLLGRARSRS